VQGLEAKSSLTGSKVVEHEEQLRKHDKKKRLTDIQLGHFIGLMKWLYIVCGGHNHVVAQLCRDTPPCIKHPVKATQCCLTITSKSWY
jgi:hypothetical protein